MKANELMIGDWVLLDMNWAEDDQMYARLNYQPYQIERGEDIDLAQETNCIGDADAYQPIPLTTEILSKNGFEAEKAYYGFVYFYDDDDNSLRIVFHPKESNYTRGAYSYIHIDCGCVTIDELPIQYVHELQHALRLCGIEKEIEL